MRNIQKRKGIIKLRNEVIKDPTLFRSLLSLFGQFVPIYSTTNPLEGFTYYHGYSIEFEEVEDGEPLPTYDAILNLETGKIKIKKHENNIL